MSKFKVGDVVRVIKGTNNNPSENCPIVNPDTRIKVNPLCDSCQIRNGRATTITFSAGCAYKLRGCAVLHGNLWFHDDEIELEPERDWREI
jgi:hypothetical protein